MIPSGSNNGGTDGKTLSAADQYNIIIEVSDEGFYLDSYYRERAGAAGGGG